MKEIKVFVKHPGIRPYEAKVENSLATFQAIVNGYIETLTLANGLLIICDEEGRLKGYERCCRILGQWLCGTVIFAGYRGDEFSDCPVNETGLKALLPRLWEE